MPSAVVSRHTILVAMWTVIISVTCDVHTCIQSENINLRRNTIMFTTEAVAVSADSNSSSIKSNNNTITITIILNLQIYSHKAK